MQCPDCLEFACRCEEMGYPRWEHDGRWSVTPFIHSPKPGEWFVHTTVGATAHKPTMCGWEAFRRFKLAHPEFKTGEIYWSGTNLPAQILVYVG